MTATAHALVAGMIASRFTDPWISGSLALGSHYVMDSIPHWDFGTNWRNRPKQLTGMFAIAETLFGIGISYWFFGQNLNVLHWAITMLLALLPDWLETPWYIWFASRQSHGLRTHASLAEKISYGLYKIPNVFHSKAQFPFGIYTQVATVIFFLTLLS